MTEVEINGRTMTITRIFDAPKQLVFEAHSSCEHLKHWWGPRTWPMVECNLDFQEGGRWHYCLRGPNEGDESWGLGLYKEINPSDKIVYIDHFSDKEGTINEAMPGNLVTIELNEKDGKTELVSISQFKTAEECKKIVDMGAVEGYSETLDRLEEHLVNVR